MKQGLSRMAGFGLRVLRDFFLRNHGLVLAGAVAYNMMLSLIPLCAVLLVVGSHFFEPELLIESITREAELISPAFVGTLAPALEGFLSNRELIGWTGLAVLVFFSSMAFRVLEDAIGTIFQRPLPTLRRKFWISALLPFFFILVVAAGVVLITSANLLLGYRGPLLEMFPLWGKIVHRLGQPLMYGLCLMCLVLLFALFYTVMPVAKVRFHRALAGAFTAAALWEITRSVLVVYYTRYSIVNMIYGSIATIIIVLLTMEIVALILLLGAQVIADLQRNANLGIPWFADPEKIAPRADDDFRSQVL